MQRLTRHTPRVRDLADRPAATDHRQEVTASSPLRIALVTRHALWFFMIAVGDLILLGATNMWLDGEGAPALIAMAVGGFLMAGYLWWMGRAERRSATRDEH